MCVWSKWTLSPPAGNTYKTHDSCHIIQCHHHHTCSMFCAGEVNLLLCCLLLFHCWYSWPCDVFSETRRIFLYEEQNSACFLLSTLLSKFKPVMLCLLICILFSSSQSESAIDEGGEGEYVNLYSNGNDTPHSVCTVCLLSLSVLAWVSLEDIWITNEHQCVNSY